MADLSIAWNITKQHEGQHYTTSKDDQGNFYNGKLYGSKFGVTAKFLIELCKVKNVTPSMIENLTDKQAVAYIETHVWKKMLKGDQIKDQYVANLLFDWFFQRYGTAIKLVGKAFQHTPDEVSDMVNTLKLSDKIISDINQTDPQIAYNTIKEARYIFTTKSGTYVKTLETVKKRVLSFKDFPSFSCGVGQVLTKEDICGENKDESKSTNNGISKALIYGLTFLGITKSLKLW